MSKLRQEIKEVMGQIVPVVMQLMNSTCSPQVLDYIQQVTTSLTRLRQLQDMPQGTASPRYAEFSQFFHHQIDSLLLDAFSKYSGRRYVFFAVVFMWLDGNTLISNSVLLFLILE